ncbi:M23 family metallopeptidase [Chryseobacterium sp. SNU WT5]|uniref:M23 family metallopeptidase n=1 Tax=Chryseobacterium sp. SNU WT5 TaxID=2594269 RepID=UPI00117E8542|nr:M23 family metallopeptidase [Chryseobacterium sp. SNU WT5]QDP84307.1 M23 family metallopeptidase [Chryseobacterium sp. SNU WT5]
MKNFLSSKKNINLLLGVLVMMIFGQALVIGKLYADKDDKSYQVNIVPIKTEKDSVDYLAMKNNLALVDHTVRELNSFLAAKNLSDSKIQMLVQDSISNDVYLSKQTNRYSQYLMDLQTKLLHVPLGVPTDGYISSNFGKRTNPIPLRTVVLASIKPLKAASQFIEEKDSLGNVVKRIAINNSQTPLAAQNNAPAEKNQVQFHKGLDIAVAHGSAVRSAAAGKVIFAGVKGGYGNCVIISHGNGLDTLYGHLSALLVKTNDMVNVNDVIAKSGNTGRSTGPHLHYEVHKNNTPVNPKLFLNL